MTRSAPFLTWLPALAVLLGLASCGLISLRPERQTTAQPTGPAQSAAHRIVQLGEGPAKRFAICTEPACPVPTRKTLAVARGVEGVAAPLNAVPPAVATTVPVVRPRPISETEKAVKAKVLVLYFGSDRSTLSAAHKAQLATAADALRRANRILVLGRTDNAGPAARNEAVALSRAAAVRDYLVRAVPRMTDDIRVDARGLCCYAAPNDTASGRAMNRRVELIFVPSTDAPPKAGSLPPDPNTN